MWPHQSGDFNLQFRCVCVSHFFSTCSSLNAAQSSGPSLPCSNNTYEQAWLHHCHTSPRWCTISSAFMMPRVKNTLLVSPLNSQSHVVVVFLLWYPGKHVDLTYVALLIFLPTGAELRFSCVFAVTSCLETIGCDSLKPIVCVWWSYFPITGADDEASTIPRMLGERALFWWIHMLGCHPVWSLSCPPSLSPLLLIGCLATRIKYRPTLSKLSILSIQSLSVFLALLFFYSSPPPPPHLLFSAFPFLLPFANSPWWGL